MAHKRPAMQSALVAMQRHVQSCKVRRQVALSRPGKAARRWSAPRFMASLGWLQSEAARGRGRARAFQLAVRVARGVEAGAEQDADDAQEEQVLHVPARAPGAVGVGLPLYPGMQTLRKP